MKRREFIIKSSIATVAISTSAAAMTNVLDFKNANKTLAIESIERIRNQFNSDTQIYPGHGEMTSLKNINLDQLNKRTI